MVYGLRLARPDLQVELVREARAGGAVCYSDPEGFVVVHSEDDVRVLQRRLGDIRVRALQRDWWCFSSDAPRARDAKRKEVESRGVPFLEYDTFSDDPRPRNPHPHPHPHPQPLWRQHHLDIRRESSLPKGQRPWNRK